MGAQSRGSFLSSPRFQPSFFIQELTKGECGHLSKQNSRKAFLKRMHPGVESSQYYFVPYLEVKLLARSPPPKKNNNNEGFPFLDLRTIPSAGPPARSLQPPASAEGLALARVARFVRQGPAPAFAQSVRHWNHYALGLRPLGNDPMADFPG